MRIRWLAATAYPVLRMDWELGPYWEVLDCSPGAVDLTRLSQGNLPFINGHRWFEGITMQIGRVEAAFFTPAGLELDVDVFEEALPPGRAARMASGQAGGTSVGYATHDAEVTGRAEDGLPIVTIKRWELMEFSSAPVPADPFVAVLTTSLDPVEQPAGTLRAAQSTPMAA